MIGREIRFLVAAAGMTLVLACGRVASSEQATITVDPTRTFQTITEWEATGQAGALACAPSDFGKTWPNVCGAFSRYKDSLFDQTVNELGINRVRLETYAGVENPIDYFAQHLNGQITERDWVHKYGRSPVNDDNDPNNINWSGFHFTMLDHTIETVVLPLKQRVNARGEKFFVNLCFVHFEPSDTGFYQYDNPAEYAEFMLATYLHMQQRYNLVPDAIEVILEPDSHTHFDGAKIGNAIKATVARLEGAGFKPLFIVPSTTNASNAVSYFNQIRSVLGDANVRRYIREISYHRYAGVNNNTLQSISSTAAANGIGASMLEWIGASYQELHTDLTVGGNTAWAQYGIAGTYYWGRADNGGAYFKVDDTNPTAPKILMMSRTKLIRQYTKFIRPGAIRVGAQTSNATFNPIAFRNDNNHGGGYVLVVKADAGGSLVVRGLPPGSYGIKYTTLSQYDVDVPDVTVAADQSLTASMPGAGVLTVYARKGVAAALSTPAP